MIRKLTKDNISDAFMIIKSVIEKMNSENIFQWDDLYPKYEIIAQDINQGYAYGYFKLSELIGIVAVNEEYPIEYDSINWQNKVGKSLIIHRLSVKSNCQGQGIGKELMIFIEEYAKNNGYSSIKLDAFLNNQSALKLYENLGYNNIGEVNFRKGIFNCYEKVL